MVSRRALFVISYAVAFLCSKYLGLVTGYALDDYSIVSKAQPDGFFDFFLSQGRYTNAALDALLRASNLTMTDFSVISFIATLIFSALFYLNTLAPRYEHKLASIVAVASLLGAHSYYTEYVTFRQSALPMSVMFAMLWIAATQYRQAIFAKDRRTFRLSLALVAGTIAMGANQLALCFAAIAVLYMHLSYTLYDHLPESKSPIVNFKALAQPILVTALAGATLTATNLLVSVAARSIAGVAPNDRASLIALSELPARGQQLLDLIPQLVITQEPIASTPAKLMILLSLATLLVPTSRRQLKYSAVALTFLFVACCIALFPPFFAGVWWPVPRTLIAIPFALVGTMALSDQKNHWKTGLAAAFALIASILFAAHSNAALSNQQRLNRWDMAQAQEITYRVAGRFPMNQGKIAIVGGAWSYPLTPGMPQGDMNLSAMSIGWAIDPLFDEATGVNLKVRAAPEFAAECSGKNKFPADESMIEKNDEVAVCL